MTLLPQEDLCVVDDSSFDDLVINVDDVVVVAFVTSWCHYCVKYKLILQELAVATPYITYFICDIDNSPESVAYYDVKSIPSTLIFLGGNEIAHEDGFMDLDDLVKFIDESLNDATSFSRKRNH